MEIKNYCLNDFDLCEEHYLDYFKAKNKNDSNFYYIKKYHNHNIDKEKLENIQKELVKLSDITKLKFYGLFEETSNEGKDLYLIFEFFDGKLVYSNNCLEEYEIWNIAQKLLEIFENLSKKGIKFNKNKPIDVFEVNINELKLNVFEIISYDSIKNNEKNENKEAKDKKETKENNAKENETETNTKNENEEKKETNENKEINKINENEENKKTVEKNDVEDKKEANNDEGILFNLAIFLEKIIEKDRIYNGFINDLKNYKIDILTTKILCNLFFRYSLNLDNINNEIIFDKGMIYVGSLKDKKPNGIGMLVNEFGIIYKGEFKEGEINGKGKLFVYDKNLESLNRKGKNLFGNCKPNICYNYGSPFGKNIKPSNSKKNNLLKIFEGNFTEKVKNGKFIEYDKNNTKIYEGEFKDDNRNGKGIEYSYGNKIYDGEFKNNIKEGKGIEYSYGNKIYEGEFKNNIKDGKGIEYENGYKKYQGCFKNGKREGTGTIYTNQSTIRYEGNFENNNFHGKGKLYYDNGKIQYAGNFDNGFFSGEGYYYDMNGEKIKVINGLPTINTKRFQIYYNSGKKHYELYVSKSNGTIQGKKYDENNHLKYNGYFRNRNIKEKETVNLEDYKNKNEYICLIKEGNGTSYNDDETVLYKGNFKNNYYNGKGILYNYNYEKERFILYEGSFLNGNYNGYGILYFNYCKIKQYEGNFLNGIYNGKGIKYNEKGEEVFKGNFKEGNQFSGFLTSPDYIGQIDNGVKNGKGKKFIDKILRFDGTFKNDKFIEGIVYTINNKKFFEGKINDKEEKIGKFFNDDYNYEGKFEDFLKTADYIVDFTNKCTITFEGDYKNGMKCGKGKDFLTGYEGEYLYDLYYGKGKIKNKTYNLFGSPSMTYVTPNGIEGDFKNGKKVGYWKESDFEGEYKDGKRNGKGIENSWTGYYVNNYLHGIRKQGDQQKIYCFGEEVNILNYRKENNCIYVNNIKEYEGDLKNGIKDGQGIEFYKNGKKRYEGSFKNGKHHGKGKEFYENEILKYEGEFNMDEYDKSGIEYDETGQKIYEGEFKKGKYDGKGKLYRNGKLLYEGDFVDNKLQGKGKEFDEEGKLLYSGEFQNNAYNGFGSRFLVRPYEGYWSNNRPDRLKQGFYLIGKGLKLVS